MNWIRIFATNGAMESSLPEGTPRLLLAEGRRICLVRHRGNVHAVQDACPHNGESLSKGHINHLGEVVCPWHGHQFSLVTGRECAERSGDLDTYPVQITDEGIFIGL